MERLIVKFGTPKPIGFREYDENTVSGIVPNGSPIRTPGDKYCRNCGTKREAGAKFCPECGSKFS